MAKNKESTVVFRIESELKKKAEKKAAVDQRTLSGLLRLLLIQYLNGGK